MDKEKIYLSSREIKTKENRKFKSKYLKGRKAFNTISKVFKYAKPYRHYLYLTFVFDLIHSIAELLVPIFIYSLIMLSCVIIASIFNALGSYTINIYNYKTTYRIRDLLFKKINSLPLSYIDSTSHGDLLSRMINDIDVITDGSNTINVAATGIWE